MLKKRPQSHCRCRCRQCQNRLVFAVSFVVVFVVVSKACGAIQQSPCVDQSTRSSDVVDSSAGLSSGLEELHKVEDDASRACSQQCEPVLMNKHAAQNTTFSQCSKSCTAAPRAALMLQELHCCFKAAAPRAALMLHELH
jgi:hypothetical protein